MSEGGKRGGFVIRECDACRVDLTPRLTTQKHVRARAPTPRYRMPKHVVIDMHWEGSWEEEQPPDALRVDTTRRLHFCLKCATPARMLALQDILSQL